MGIRISQEIPDRERVKNFPPFVLNNNLKSQQYKRRGSNPKRCSGCGRHEGLRTTLDSVPSRWKVSDDRAGKVLGGYAHLSTQSLADASNTASLAIQRALGAPAMAAALAKAKA
jgi:hypothetical protein